MPTRVTAKGVQVSATLPTPLFTALDEHRWSVRKTMTELVRTAVEEYAERNGIQVPAPEEGAGEA